MSGRFRVLGTIKSIWETKIVWTSVIVKIDNLHMLRNID